MTIESFPKGSEHFFLSSMYPVPGKLESPVDPGVRVPTAEHAYQASKLNDISARNEVYGAVDGYDAKKIAHRLISEGAVVVGGWDDEAKIAAMRRVVESKFQKRTKMAHLLLGTGDETIEEGNTWGDDFWGITPPGSGNGQNWLGCLLMLRRQELKD